VTSVDTLAQSRPGWIICFLCVRRADGIECDEELAGPGGSTAETIANRVKEEVPGEVWPVVSHLEKPVHGLRFEGHLRLGSPYDRD
jgi:hypothetical protein